MYKLHIQKHPFRTDVEYYDIEDGLTLQEAYDSSEPVLPIEHARMTVNDEVVSDYTRTPSDGDIVCVKVVPGEDTDVGFWGVAAIIGSVVVGSLVALIPGAQIAALWIVGAGITLGAGMIGAQYIIDSAQFDSEEGRQDIHGSSGSTSRWTPIPLVYGKHYLAPSLASSDYTELENPGDLLSDVVLHQLYILGDQIPDWGTHTIVDSINIGDNRLFESREMQLTGYIEKVNSTQAKLHLVSSLSADFADLHAFMYDPISKTYVTSAIISIEGHGRPANNRAFLMSSHTAIAMTLVVDDFIPDDETIHTIIIRRLQDTGVYRGLSMALIQDGVFTGTPYPQIVFESYVGKELRYDSPSTFFTTPSNVKKATVVVTCPQGLYGLDGNSKKKVSVSVQVRAKRVGTDDWLSWQTISINEQNTNKARRKELTIAFGFPGQWLMEFKKTTRDLESEDGVNTVTLDRVRCEKTRVVYYQGELASAPADPEIDWVYTNTTNNNVYVYTSTGWRVYVDDEFDLQPVHEDIKTSFSYMALAITATDQLNGAVNNLNMVLRHEVHAFDEGAVAGEPRWVPAYSNNPAAVFVDTLLNPIRNRYPLIRNVDWTNTTNVPIDWDMIEDWYIYCEDNGFTCNGVLSESSTVKDELEKIALTGRANFTMKDGLYSVNIDRIQATPVQLFTPRNTHSFSASRTFLDRPDGVRVKFTNEDIGYQADEVRIDFADSDQTTYDELSLVYITTATQAMTYAKYYLNVIEARQESFTFSTDFEYLVCTAGDRIKFQHDVPLYGMLGARVSSVLEAGGEIVGIVIDETADMKMGESYAIELRVPAGDGTFQLKTLPVANAETTTNTLTFVTPQTLNSIHRGDLLAFGETTLVTEDLIISEITTGEDLSAVLTCTKYDEAIYDTSAFVEWASSVGRPASSPRQAYVEDATSRALTDLTVIVDESRGNKVFNETQPTTPYRIGDIWRRGINMYVTTVSRTEDESFTSSDWQLATTDTFQAVSVETFQQDHPEHRWYMSPADEYPMLEVHGFQVLSEVGANVKENVLDDDESYWESLAALGILTVPEPADGGGYRMTYVKAVTAPGQTSYVAGRWGLDAWHGESFTNLIVSPNAPATQNITLETATYVLQTYAGTVTCSYGSATPNNPLVFSATAGVTEFTMANAQYVSLTKTNFIPPYAVGTYANHYNTYSLTLPTASGIFVVHNRPSSFSNIAQLYLDANNYIALGIIGDVLRVIRKGAGAELYEDYVIDNYVIGEDLPFTIAYDSDTHEVDITLGNEATVTMESWVFGYDSGGDEIVFGYESGGVDYVFGYGVALDANPDTLYVGCLHTLASYANNQIHMVSY